MHLHRIRLWETAYDYEKLLKAICMSYFMSYSGLCSANEF